MQVTSWKGVLALLIFGMCLGECAAQNPGREFPLTIEAARSDWNAQVAPQTGWREVRLPDNWREHWPQHDGVVWYRLRWLQSELAEDLGLYIEYVTLAAEVRVNGQLLARDPSLVEPLSRMWNSPRIWRLPTALQRIGENIVLVRVSGFSAYSGGLGPVIVGVAVPLEARQAREQWLRQRMGFVSVGIEFALGSFFLMLWFMRRSEVAYGWFSAQQLAWLPVAWNQVSTTPLMFSSTHDYQSMVMVMLMMFSGCWVMFVLRFCEQRWPKREFVLWSVLISAALLIVLAPPEHKREIRESLLLLAMLVNISADILFIYLASRFGRTDQRVLASFSVLGLIAGSHDALAAMGIIEGETYFATLTLNISVLGVAVVLAWNFSRNLRRIEGFSSELQASVTEARGELAATLQRQHELEIVHARLGERVGLAHDLHDGLGGMLIGNIATMEQAPEQQFSARQVLGMLRELRDDLRLIIDTASAQHYGEHSLAELLAPLRHRMSRLFEAHEIAVKWQVAELEQVYLSTSHSLDVLRVVQEALTNILKHAHASRVRVLLEQREGRIVLEVEDNGRGMDAATRAKGGVGLRSIEARARRLSGELTLDSTPPGTTLRLSFELPETAMT